ncbi:MAG TPA: S9 family peptidase, partial [Kofleriaceae bacterium]|nr:S9 family peptidase [Kofleriaceae bacterium]
MRFTILLSILFSATVAHAKAGLTPDDMLAMQRVGEPIVSPDGKWIAFDVRDTDLDANRGRYDVWVAAVDGSKTSRLTTDPENDNAPAWSPDGKWIYFLSSRGGSSQVWRIAPTGGEAEQVTKLATDVGGFRVFPDGKRLLLAIEVWPNAKSIADSLKMDDAAAKKKTKAKIYDHLFFRHWDEWEDGKFSHLFVWTSDQNVKDLTAGQATDSPTKPFGGMEETAISPDGKTVAFCARIGANDAAWTTNTDVFLVDASGKGKPVNLTIANKAYDSVPVFSPDGKSLAVTAMARAGYESDRTRITIYDVASKKPRVLTEQWDRSAQSIEWSADGKTIYTTAEDLGNQALFAIDVATGKATSLVAKGTNATPHVAGDRLVFARDTLKNPTEIYAVAPTGGDIKAITHLNDARIANIAWGDYEQFSFKGAKGDTVYGFVMKPAGYSGKGKVPVAFLIHGGPQGSFGDHFHYRWNPEVFAGHGYAAVFIDFHGSTGYGQAFTDAINGDWGGAPYDDLMMGLDAALKKYTWLDGSRTVALGASYGGFMINWINGHTDRFKALVVHDGNLDERTAYYDTEELWFPEWEHGGTEWDHPEGYQKATPIDYVKNWKTPTLVVHGGNDFRVV